MLKGLRVPKINLRGICAQLVELGAKPLWRYTYHYRTALSSAEYGKKCPVCGRFPRPPAQKDRQPVCTDRRPWGPASRHVGRVPLASDRRQDSEGAVNCCTELHCFAERLPDLRALGDSPVASMDCVQVGNRQSCCAEVPAMAACVVVRAGRSWHRQPGVSAQGVQRTVHARLAVAARRRAAVGFASAKMHDGLR